MTISDYIRDDVFAKRAAESGCLVIYDPRRRYRTIVSGMNSATCRVIDASTSVIEQREAAMAALLDLAEGTIHQFIVWVPAQHPESDEAAGVRKTVSLFVFSIVAIGAHSEVREILTEFR
jgi:hypothetical protein